MIASRVQQVRPMRLSPACARIAAGGMHHCRVNNGFVRRVRQHGRQSVLQDVVGRLVVWMAVILPRGENVGGPIRLQNGCEVENHVCAVIQRVCSKTVEVIIAAAKSTDAVRDTLAVGRVKLVGRTRIAVVKCLRITIWVAEKDQFALQSTQILSLGRHRLVLPGEAHIGSIEVAVGEKDSRDRLSSSMGVRNDAGRGDDVVIRVRCKDQNLCTGSTGGEQSNHPSNRKIPKKQCAAEPGSEIKVITYHLFTLFGQQDLFVTKSNDTS